MSRAKVVPISRARRRRDVELARRWLPEIRATLARARPPAPVEPDRRSLRPGEREGA